ncbi:MAG: UDP-N-acetylmuramate--L-alanine ligase [Myxococcota bacterium]
MSRLGLAARVRRIHFVGIGGIGMSGIARVLLELGHTVSGSDRREGPGLDGLREAGALVRVGHEPEAVEGADVVVVSSAIPLDNPEVVAARQDGIPVIPRAEMLAELMRSQAGIAVAGSHGKTTTTSLIGSVLAHAGLDPTIVVGGALRRWGTGHRGAGDLMVAEADESDGSFLLLAPTISVVTNIDPEHLEHYGGSTSKLEAAFSRFLGKTPFYGRVVACIDDPGVGRVLDTLDRPRFTYGLDARADFSLRVGTVERSGQSIRVRGPDGEHAFWLPMLGIHNALNATAAVAVGHDLGLEPERVAEGLAAFEGVDRRFTIRGVVGEVEVVDDYGHHPTEIVATLQGVREARPRQRILVGFQPHRFSRTRDFLGAFARAFDGADMVVVAPVYAAGEAPMAGATADDLVEAMRRHGHPSCRLASNCEQMSAYLIEKSEPGDLILLLGAGDISDQSPRILGSLGSHDGREA